MTIVDVRKLMELAEKAIEARRAYEAVESDFRKACPFAGPMLDADNAVRFACKPQMVQALCRRLLAADEALRDRSCFACETHRILYDPNKGCGECQLESVLADLAATKAKLGSLVDMVGYFERTCSDPKHTPQQYAHALDMLSKESTRCAMALADVAWKTPHGEAQGEGNE